MTGNGRGRRRGGLAAAAVSVLLGAFVTCSYVPGAAAATASGTDELTEDAVATVVVDGVELFPVRGVSAYPAERRAARIAARIEAIAADPAIDAGSVRVDESAAGSHITAGGRDVVTILDADAQLAHVDRRSLALAAAARVAEAIEAYRQHRKPRYLLTRAGYALLATVALAGFLWLVAHGVRRIEAALERWTKARLAKLESHSRHFVRAAALWKALLGLHHVAWAVAVLAAVVAYLEFVLNLFPWTRPVGQRLLALVLDPLRRLGGAFVEAIPDLIFLAVLFVLTRYALKSIRLFFTGLARGTIVLTNFEREWAWPTYRLVRGVVLLFAAIVAYPYIPGSQTDAFKGISIFVGVLLSIGSTATIGNLVAGYSLVYRRAFRIGDRVRIGEHVGDIIERRLLVTQLRTPKNEDVVVPNSIILNSSVVNYSTLAQEGKLILHTTVGIGYETPWRQVEAMLTMAADRCEGLLKDPPPFVLQTALGDFAVTYEINAFCGDARAMPRLYAELHRNILDVFNEYGIQIMTPAYEADPAEPKLVPREQWHAAPAAVLPADSREGGRPG